MDSFKKKCKHEWKWDDISVIHYPDYEPHKIGIKYHCIKCGKNYKIAWEKNL